VVDAVARQLPRPGLGEYEVTLKAGIDDLDNDVLVSEADDETILGRIATDLFNFSALAKQSNILFILRLGNQPLAGVVYPKY
jgi:hypothetical protein